MTEEITVREAVKLSRFSRQAIYNAIVAGRLKARKVGWQYFIERAALVEYLSRGKKKA